MLELRAQPVCAIRHYVMRHKDHPVTRNPDRARVLSGSERASEPKSTESKVPVFTSNLSVE